MSVQVSYKKQILFGVLLLVILLICVEGIIRLYEFINPPNCSLLESDSYKNLNMWQIRQICSDTQNLLYQDSAILLLKPNQHFSTINIDSQGFRGGEVTTQKPDGVYRIFIVGGSTTFGAGSISDQTTIPAFLQQEFNDHNMKYVQVINAGIPEADSSREAYYIKKTLINYQPDMFIVYDGWNDAAHRRLTEPVEIVEKKSIFNYFKFHNFPQYRTPFYINKILHPLEGAGPTVVDNTIDQVIIKWKERWTDVCKLGKEKNFKTIIIIQPHIETGHKKLTKSEQQIPLSGIEPKIINGLRNSTGELNSVCDKTTDFTDVFDNISEPVFTDRGHTGDYGNSIIANHMFELSQTLISTSK